MRQPAATLPAVPLTLLRADEILARMEPIPGWFTVEEAGALLGAAVAALTQTPGPHQIVEIGSFSGRSTTVLGSAVQALSPASTVHAVDPHDGCTAGGRSTADRFARNIGELGLAEHVRLIKQCSFDVEWDQPISLLFVDGLHDFASVAIDLFHFEHHVIDGGLVAFHDYEAGWPEVVAFVDQLTTSGKYEQLTIGGSCIVLRKLGSLIGMQLKPSLDSMEQIFGWFSRAEGAQLAISAAQALAGPGTPGAVVEIGPMHGRSTSVLGAVARQLGAKLHSVDRFDGLVGALPQLTQIEPYRAAFEKTVHDLGLADTVEVHESPPLDLEWDRPVSFLLVDGWRDYESVYADFAHFDPWIQDGGLVAFHDFQRGWPGVQTAVWDVLDNPSYTKVAQAETLVVVRKHSV